MESNGKLKRKMPAQDGIRPGTALLCDLMPRSFKGAPNTIKRLKFIANRRCFCDLQVPNKEPCTHRNEATSPLERPQDCVLEEHNYCLNKKTARELQDAVTAVGAMCDDLQNEVQALRRTAKQRDKSISKYHALLVVRTVDEKTSPHRFTWRQFSKDPRVLEALTGFDNEQKLQKFMNTVGSGYNFKRAVQLMSFILPLEDQLFLVLTHFKFGFSEKDLMQQFNMTIPAMEKTVAFWMDLLHRQLTRMPIWPERNGRSRKVIIDCAKVFVDYTESYQRERTLLGLTPDGAICFVSDMYSDEYSEVEVAEKCGILKLLESGDEIFADDAFLIENFIQDGVKLSRPLDAKKDPILCQEIIRAKNVAERVIRNIRGYKILEMPHFYGKSSRIFQICCHLVNFNRDCFLERKDIVCD